jgi:rSAM/selenodomain-associated transferase 1
VRSVIILFAKAPIAGCVKTRLASEIGDGRAVQLHRAFVADTIAKLSAFREFADLQLHTDIPTDAWSELNVTRELQSSGGLQLKLLHALAVALDAGRPRAIVFGSDSPTLPHAHVLRLLESTADVTLGPCEDGGYYAIACRRVHPEMFAGVEWSTPHVLDQTERAARACGLSVERGDLWYDVDSPEDLVRLMAEPELPYCTSRALRAGCRGPSE